MLLVGTDASLDSCACAAVCLWLCDDPLQGIADAARPLTFSVAVHHVVLISAWPAVHGCGDGSGLRQSDMDCAVGAL